MTSLWRVGCDKCGCFCFFQSGARRKEESSASSPSSTTIGLTSPARGTPPSLRGMALPGVVQPATRMATQTHGVTATRNVRLKVMHYNYTLLDITMNEKDGHLDAPCYVCIESVLGSWGKVAHFWNKVPFEEGDFTIGE